MYEDLVKRLREEADCPDNYAEDSCLMREAADAIEELSVVVRAQKAVLDKFQNQKWIPVTERLPKADERDERGFAVPYLVMNGWMRVTARRTKDYWVLFGVGTVLEYVTHWMSLPKPPKEGET